MNMLKNLQASKPTQKESDFKSVVITTFVAVFLAELGDKTQIATLLLSAESGRPIIVFVGASLALIASSLVGVLIGGWLVEKISPDKFEIAAGLVMILISIWLLVEATAPFLFEQLA